MATLRLFAQARELAGTGKVEIAGATVGEVVALARTRFGDDFAAVVDNSRLWLNGSPTSVEESIGAADELAILPPVSGG